jgi:hypothetical protein
LLLFLWGSDPEKVIIKILCVLHALVVQNQVMHVVHERPGLSSKLWGGKSAERIIEILMNDLALNLF